jgi:hypothetical protein
MWLATEPALLLEELSTFKMEASGSSETSAATNKVTIYYSPQDHNVHISAAVKVLKLVLSCINFFIIFHINILASPSPYVNPLNTELNPICHLLVLLETHYILHISRIRVKIGLLIQKYSCQEPRIDSTVAFRIWLCVLCTIV